MKITDNSSPSSTLASYTVTADENEIKHAKDAELTKLAKNIKVPGFRQGKVPFDIVEKNTSPATIQSEVANHVINDLYSDSINQINLIPVGNPKITLTKFVPYSTLEFKVEVAIVGNLKLADYKKVSEKLKSYPVKDSQIDDALKELQKRAASYKPVSRPSKIDDRLNIDFTGSDAKSNAVLEKASSKHYFLTLGSNTFIPGFEDKLIGKKTGADVTFDLTFPDNYFDQEFKGRKINFKVKVNSVEEPELVAINDQLAAKVGPFKSLAELKTQLKNELQRENDRRARQEQDNAVLDKLADILDADLPDTLLNEEVESIKRYDQNTALNSGLTWKEFLAKEKLSQDEYDKKIKPAALKRLKVGLAIIEIAKKENISVSNDEIEDQLNQLKKQYSDPAMQAELNSDAVKADLTKRILTQKVVDHIKNLS